MTKSSLCIQLTIHFTFDVVGGGTRLNDSFCRLRACCNSFDVIRVCHNCDVEWTNLHNPLKKIIMFIIKFRVMIFISGVSGDFFVGKQMLSQKREPETH